ncbi:MAG: putative rane protein [Herbinix sp.]|jgi:uncharacterized membrane protein YesL|nr:putative rane protein [Herbinix sp.]
MNNIFNMENGFFSVLSKICDILFISVVWALLCIPIVTIGPATTALYYATVKVVRRERGYLFREFFRSFKDNFKNGAIIGVIITVVTIILIFDRTYAKALIEQNNSNLGMILLSVFTAMVVLLLCFTIYVFPILSRFTMTKRQLVKSAFFMSIKHLPSTIAMAVIVALFALISYGIPIFIFIAPGLTAFLVSLLMERIFKKYMPKSEGNSEETGKDEWYLE